LTRKALITGGAGFIGSHVADLFIEKGWQVDVLDNLSSGREANLSPKLNSFFRMDVADDSAATLVREGKYDAICHLAAQIDVRKSVTDPLFDARVNILGTIGLLEAVRQSGHDTRFVFSSTGGAIYGGFVEPPCDENAVKEPEAPYGTSKLSAEYYLAFYSRVLSMDTVALRYSNVFGPRQDPHGEAGVVAIFCGRILDGRALTVFGDGMQTRDYVFAGDVARANFLAATSALPAAGGVDARSFNIGTGVETSVIELARVLNEAGGSPVPLDHAPARMGELARSAVDPSRAERAFGWKAEVSLQDGLRETYEWFSARHVNASERS
jgi:UDP-glucose 4-epimerase